MLSEIVAAIESPADLKVLRSLIKYPVGMRYSDLVQQKNGM